MGSLGAFGGKHNIALGMGSASSESPVSCVEARPQGLCLDSKERSPAQLGSVGVLWLRLDGTFSPVFFLTLCWLVFAAVACLLCSLREEVTVTQPGPGGVLPAWQDLASVPRHECFRVLLIPGSKPSWDPASESEPSAPSTQALGHLCWGLSCGDRGASLLSFPRVQTSGLSFCSFSSQPSPYFCLFSTSYYEVLQTHRPRENCSLDTPSPSPGFLRPPAPGCVRLTTHVSPLCSVSPASGALWSSRVYVYPLALHCPPALVYLLPGWTAVTHVAPASTARLAH